MKVTAVRTTPLFLPYKQPYHWAFDVVDGAEIVLVAIETDSGITGYGECCCTPDGATIRQMLARVTPALIGTDAFSIAASMERLHRSFFASHGPGNQRRLSNQVLCGIELALWDAVGKALGQPVYNLLGGAVRDDVAYFGFVQGNGPAEVAASAAELADRGFEVIYAKVGRGDAIDIANVRAIREAIGDKRLRLDANEAWDTLTARRMVERLRGFDIEFLEQPSPSESPAALARIRRSLDIPIAADQLVMTPSDVFEVCRHEAADVIVLGLHEVGGILGLRKAAAVAESAGLSICLHGVYESGITTCASNVAAATIPNLDDGNQLMIELLADDIVASPQLFPVLGRLAVLEGPGLGFELDMDAVARGAERWRQRQEADA